ncbi:MAG: hypothetical protein AVDCRST_MAG56-1872 [uncultured Cytophagales bacterium]|uniref:Uncharacterized protein n=1 Tax=uncultured Cytophagales bacterium TaxID=158755 RepID=A0A6J4IGL3_9SPHI|nr:MAG: hypothetical protein AVDCRST_MAG56-1872 [uncultured Cytophagales bacterium]
MRSFARYKQKIKPMEKRIIHPWQWQDGRSYVQAGLLY